MPKRKKERGRPGRPLPPKIDASPEKIARVVLNAGRPKGPFKETNYRCAICEREVYYPETLYTDKLCLECHTTVLA